VEQFVMGVIYSVACKTCKVTRDLDKFYSSDTYEVETRGQALKYRKEIEKDSFRAGLLVSFMAKHKGHDCVFFNEHSECEEDLDPFENEHGYIEDTNFWSEP
jgi:hypothetical protein